MTRWLSTALLLLSAGCKYGPQDIPALREEAAAHEAMGDEQGAWAIEGIINGLERKYGARQATVAVPQETEVLSEPPGARIIVQGEYVGDAPTVVKWDQHGIVGMQFVRDILVEALPVNEGQWRQQTVFSPYDRIPRRMFFDTRLRPAEPPH